MAVQEKNERLVAALRLAVAVGALAIFVLDPDEHPGRRPFAIGVLALFVAYSVVFYLRAVRHARSDQLDIAPWHDVAWVTLAAAVSQATSEIFYPLYLFAILCASFWSGFRRGFAVAVVSAVAYAVVGTVTAPPGTDLHIFLTRPAYLVVLGYLMAVWGGHELHSRARLQLLREVTALASPRFGVDAAVGRILEAVRAFFDADACRWVVADDLAGRKWMRAALRERGPDAGATELPPDVAGALLPPPADAAFLVNAGFRREVVFALPGHEPPHGDPAVGAALLTALEAGALLSVPFRFHATAAGRVYVTARRRRRFERGDAEFLRHVAEQVIPMLENLRLVDQLASDAANEERRRIALDLHDSVIQPYLGLRLGLSAASAALAGGRAPEAGAHVERLLSLADGEIETLRGYVRTLRTGRDGEPAALEAAVRRFCRRFSEATGIRVELRTAGGPVNDGMATEVFQMVAEALSNVRRHSTAARAEVVIESEDGTLRVSVANDGAPAEPVAFFPRSLAERAASLGGKLRVERPAVGTTAVSVEVPIQPPSREVP
jgi:signal transduction histidine kinase